MKWSDSARTERDDYLKRVIEALRESEADPAEVTADLTAHFEATAHEEGLALITHHDLRRYIAHLGPAEELADIQGAREGEISAPSTNGEPPRQRGSRHIMALIFGVLIPAASYVVEVLFRGCSDLFFDPMPSIWHHGGVLAIIGVNAVNWRNVCANRLPKPYEEWGNQAFCRSAARGANLRRSAPASRCKLAISALYCVSDRASALWAFPNCVMACNTLR